jgi:hypothetical protein
MFQQKVTVHYRDGSDKDLLLTQWSIGQFAQWASRQKLDVDPDNPGMMAIVMLRYQAYAELMRDETGAKPSWAVWDNTVDEVEPEEQEAADPTQTAPSADSSP